MVLWGTVESKEAKGYMIDLGFKDGAKGFVKSSEDLPLNSHQFVIVNSSTSKLIKCDLLSDEAKSQVVSTAENELSLHTIKPGFLVDAKVSNIFENGIELRFLKGTTGTVFCDHLDKA